MAFYKYGLSFLAGTGFGAAVTSLRLRRGDDRCPLHKEKQRCRRRHGGAGAHTGESDEPHENGQERGNKTGKRCLAMKDGGKENKGGGQTTGKED